MTAAQHKGRRLAKRNPWPTVLAGLSILSAIALAFVLGYNLAILKVDKPPQAVTAPAFTSAPAPSPTPVEPPEPVRHRDDIVSEGRLLPYDLQELMQDYCEAYNVPYALALAIAEVETHFDPDAVSPTWSKEAAKWDHLQHLRISTVLGSSARRIKALNTPADVYIINRENVEWLVDYYKQAWPFDMVVLDESTSFKNSRSKRFKAMKRVRRFVKKMVLLTGTPSSKGLIDLWAQVYLLDGGARLGPTLGAYRDQYFDPDQRSRTQIFSYKAKDGAESAVLAAIADICISMKAEDYLQLPENISHEIPVMLDPKAKKAYEQFERDLLLEIDENVITAGTAGVLTGKLLQFCNGAVYGSEGQIVPVHNCKLEAYMELLERLDGEPALTFYGYQHDKDRILERLAKTKLRVRVYKGVEDEEAWNKGEVDVLLVHPASCAYGLNLQAGGRHVVWYGLNWSFELNDQGNCRLWRQGSPYDKVFIHYLIVQGCVDEDVMETIRDRADTYEAVMRALKARIKKVKEDAKK